MSIATSSELVSPLPTPRRDRWQPLRGGLLNLFKYDDQEFRYEDGRLILRGNNGAGKSRVLALQFPFLFDGDVSSDRVEPDRDQAKRIEWNLLMNHYPERAGYTWAEFGMIDSNGVAKFVTIGCGLAAVEGRGLTAKWFFVTDQRIGLDLALTTSSRTVLLRDRLTETIADRGMVFTDARSYRREVNQRLFGLDQTRYEALVTLLIELRRPQLSRSLDEKRLSEVLGQALPPPSAEVLAPVAEAFRQLEEERRKLNELRVAHRAADAFMSEYSRYAAIATRREAAQMRKTYGKYESLVRELKRLDGEQSEVRQRRDEAMREMIAAKQALSAAQEQLSILEASPERRHADDLDRARRQVTELGHLMANAERRRDSARDERRRLESRCAELRKREVERRHEHETSAAETRNAAANALFVDAHEALLAALDGTPPQAEIERVRAAHDQTIRARLDGLSALRKCADALHAEEARLARIQETLSDAETRTLEAEQSLDRARASAESAGRRLVRAVLEWSVQCTELQPMSVDALLPELEDWCGAPVAESPLAAFVTSVRDAALQRVDHERKKVQHALELKREQQAILSAEFDALSGGRHAPPAPRPASDTTDREGRLGGPLWDLCEFRPDLGASSRAGLEAALESSGLLDAWVTPDGRLLGADLRDVVLSPGRSPLPHDDHHLGRALVPSIDSDDPRRSVVDPHVVESVLRHIGLGEGQSSICVTTKGRWQLGPLHGNWTKSDAEHIGHSAREARRRRRLAELRRQLDEIGDAISALERDLDAVEARQRHALTEASAAPGTHAVVQAAADLRAADRGVNEARRRVGEIRAVLEAQHGVVVSARDKRELLHRDLGLPAGADVAEMDRAIRDYAAALRSFFIAWTACRDARHDAEQAHGSLERQRANEHAAEAELDRAGEQHRTASAQRNALEQSVGQAVETVLRLIEEQRDAIEQQRRSHENADARHRDADRADAVLSEKLTQTKRNLEVSAEQLRETTAKFAQFVGSGLPAVAAEILADASLASVSNTGAVELARRIEDALRDVNHDDDAWARNERAVNNHIERLRQSIAPHGYEPATVTEHGFVIVTVSHGGRLQDMRAFRAELETEIAHHETALTAREREVIENHLTDDLALHLHELIKAARTFVADANEEMSKRPTSTGMRLRFQWEPNEEEIPGLREARERLLRTQGTWTAQDRAALGDFLQRRIEAEREARPDTTKLDHLSSAVDYRRWHRFSVERQQDGVWRKLTRRTHGTGSGGEKALALTIPQFAAAAAYYRSANNTAPRLILLDEAFVGIDKAMRAQCMGLLTAFQLDFLMTSESEWGCYPTLPAVAICQLAARADIDAVGVTRWIWNGKECIPADATV